MSTPDKSFVESTQIMEATQEEDDTHRLQLSLEALVDHSLSRANELMVHKCSSLCDHVESSPEERKQLGVSLLEVSVEWKRILSPMVTFVLVQEALVLLFRERNGCVT
jgi:hypothetical protein